jgi:hypothetical protein
VSGDAGDGLVFEPASFDEGAGELGLAADELDGAAGDSAAVQGQAGAQLRQWLPTVPAADAIDGVEATADRALGEATAVTREDTGKLLAAKQNMLDTEARNAALADQIARTDTTLPATGDADTPSEVTQALSGASGYTSPIPGSPEYQARLNELAEDPARGGRISGKSLQEASIGLKAEANEDIPGPIKRASLSPSGVDQGEFIDADGQRWDVKSSPDVLPSYTPTPGVPIRNPQSTHEFIDMIDEELGKGEYVLLDPDGMTPGRLAQLEAITDASSSWQGKVIWVR